LLTSSSTLDPANLVLGVGHHGTDNFAGGVNSRQSTILDFKAATVVTTYL
jgi:hypothetical protein